MAFTEQAERIKIGPLICEGPYGSPNTISQVENDCPTDQPGYKWIAEKCYYFDDVERSPELAARNCAYKFKQGGKLVEPRSLETYNLIYQANSENFDNLDTGSKI